MMTYTHNYNGDVEFLECLEAGHAVELEPSSVPEYNPKEWVYLHCKTCSDFKGGWLRREKRKRKRFMNICSLHVYPTEREKERS